MTLWKEWVSFSLENLTKMAMSSKCKITDEDLLALKNTVTKKDPKEEKRIAQRIEQKVQSDLDEYETMSEKIKENHLFIQLINIE